MKYYRTVALAAAFAGGLALPALAQVASPDAAPAAQTDSANPMPDAGVKKVTPPAKKHVHHVAHRAAKPAPAKVPGAAGSK